MKKKLSSSVSVLISSVLVLLLLPGSSLRLLTMYLRHFGFNRSIFRYLSHLSREEIFIMLLSLLFLFLAIISLIKIIILSARIGSGSEIKLTPRQVTEEAINCRHSTGREKYLEQIEGYLKNGLIDRAEYNALKARYEKLDIPDDYHG
ncbi:MAG: hypothetical protein IJJ22_02495 [Oscillospiraceae bacterium]|nr:hypothetical protein [Oscillospiraceae bacterium]